MRALSIVLVFAACGDKTPPRKARDCFSYKLPAGWHEQPSKTGADLVVMNPEQFSIGKNGMRDNFTVRYLPTSALDAVERQVVETSERDAANKATRELKRAHPDVPEMDVAKVAEPIITHLTFAGLPAFRVVIDTTIDAAGDSVPMHNTTTFVKFEDEVVSIATGYVASREAVAGPAAASFLASIKFDRCR